MSLKEIVSLVTTRMNHVVRCTMRVRIALAQLQASSSAVIFNAVEHTHFDVAVNLISVYFLCHRWCVVLAV